MAPLFRIAVHVLVVHEGKVLLYPTFSNPSTFRAIGGTVEFGEYTHETAVREYKEETGIDISEVTQLGVIENKFELRGKQHEEIVFVYKASFTDGNYDRDVVVTEGEKSVPAKWVVVADIVAGNVPLVPEGIADFLDVS